MSHLQVCAYACGASASKVFLPQEMRVLACRHQCALLQGPIGKDNCPGFEQLLAGRGIRAVPFFLCFSVSSCLFWFPVLSAHS